MGVRRIDAKLELEFGRALAGLLRMVVTQVAEADLSKSLRVIFIFLVSRVSCLPNALVCAWRQFPPNRQHPQGVWIRCALPCPSATAPHRPATAMSDETILGSPRNHHETNGE
jgi:hypothetical protein